jgi:Cellulase (glycosyl hydrolase family 5)
MGRRLCMSFMCGAVVASALLTASAPAGAGPANPWVTTSGVRFVDTRSGHPIVLRGVDVAAGDNQAIQNQVAALGANFVRVHVCWSQLEPTAPSGGTHNWNQALLASMATQVAWYQAHNINVLIDLHQFNWSSYFSGRGCGIPAWFYSQIEEGRYPPSGNGLIQAMHAFYTDPAAISLYTDLAQMVAAHFDSYPAVVGYEVLNEPYGKNSHSGTQDVISFEAGIRSALAAVDPARTVFVMTRYGGDKGLLDADFSPFGSRSHLALDYHDYYSGVPGTGMSFDDENWSPDWAATHLHTTTDYHGTLSAQQAMLDYPLHKSWDLGIPVLIGEWGARRDDQNGAAYQAQMLSIMGQEGLSWARWSMSGNDMFGILTRQGQPTADFTQLQTALGSTPPPPSIGPSAPGLALSAAGFTRGGAIRLCYRVPLRATQIVLGVRTAGGARVRTRYLGAADAGVLYCEVFKGETASGRHLPAGVYMLRINAAYAGAGSRFSMWHQVTIRP